MSNMCHCGGEVQLEYFEHPKRSIEWFNRCRICGCMSETAVTPEQAQALPIVQPETELEKQA